MRRAVFVIVVVVAWMWWRHRPPNTPSTHDDQRWRGAVLADGFAVHYGDRVQELDFDGKRGANHELPGDRDTRVVGTSAGIAAGWLKNGQLQFFDVKKR